MRQSSCLNCNILSISFFQVWCLQGYKVINTHFKHVPDMFWMPLSPKGVTDGLQVGLH